MRHHSEALCACQLRAKLAGLRTDPATSKIINIARGVLTTVPGRDRPASALRVRENVCQKGCIRNEAGGNYKVGTCALCQFCRMGCCLGDWEIWERRSKRSARRIDSPAPGAGHPCHPCYPCIRVSVFRRRHIPRRSILALSTGSDDALGQISWRWRKRHRSRDSAALEPRAHRPAAWKPKYDSGFWILDPSIPGSLDSSIHILASMPSTVRATATHNANAVYGIWYMVGDEGSSRACCTAPYRPGRRRGTALLICWRRKWHSGK